MQQSEFAAWEDQEEDNKDDASKVGVRKTSTTAQQQQQDDVSSSTQIVTCKGWNAGEDTNDGDEIFTTTRIRPRANKVVNFDRLRDRWWDVLARRNCQRAFLEELKQKIKRYRQQPEVVDQHIHRDLIHRSPNLTITTTVKGNFNTPPGTHEETS